MVNKEGVTVTDLVVTRGRTTVFDGFSLELAAGGITGLLGPSGCGKTTLMRCVVGVQKIRSGTVTVLGETAGSPILRGRIGYATQSAAVYDDLTVTQNLRYAAGILGVGRTQVRRVLEGVDLGAHAEQRVDSLSGGQRSRVSLAMAMLGEPDVLVLDEPTVGLDPELREQLWGIFRSLADAGTTLLVSSHVMDEAMRCDRVVLLRAGALLAHLPPAELLARTGATDPDHAFLALVREQATVA